MKRCMILVVVLLLSVSSNPEAYARYGSAQAGPLYELRLGLAAHDVDNLWSRSRREEGLVVDGEIIFSRPQITLFNGTIRPNLGLSVHTGGDTGKLYAGILWEFEPLTPLFLRCGVGLAVHNGETDRVRGNKKALGSRVLFRIPLEAGFTLQGHHRLSIRFDHISNAALADPNEGLDTVGFFYGYRF